MKININTLKKILLILLLFNFFVKYFIDIFNLNNVIIFINDILLFIILILVLILKKEFKNILLKNYILYFICVIFLLFLFQMIFGYFSIPHFIWGFRNTYRFFIYFICCSLIFDKNDINYIIKIFNIMIIPMLIVVSYQFFVKNLFQDFIGGLFGEQYGSTGFMNVFLIIYLSINIVQYFFKKIKFKHFVFALVSSLYIATLSEIKIFYFEFVIIFFLAIFFTKKSFKKVFLFSIILFLVVLFASAFSNLYGFKRIFTLEGILDYGSISYEYSDLNRMTAFSVINRNYFDDMGLKYKLFGIGLGNAETSSINLFNTNFYLKYGEYTKYMWYSTSFTYLETGIIGIILYVSLFVKIFLDSNKVNLMKYYDDNNRLIVLCKILLVTSLILFVYNTSLRLECSYLLFCFFSIPYVCLNDFKERKDL